MQNKRRKSTTPKGAHGKRCYAIGDVHGRLDLLTELFERIERHVSLRPSRETIIVLLGDLIDRGPASREVVELVRTFRPTFARLYALSGNHEELLLRTVDGELNAFQAWMTNGGLATMRSYGVDTTALAGVDLEEFRKRVVQAIPQSHVLFLRSCADSIRFGDYLLAHAGVRPGRSLEEQTGKDLRWIRQTFLSSEADHGFVVVHGHSQFAEVEIRRNRIGIDTGAYHSGVLTAAWFEDAERGFIQTEGPAINTVSDTLFE